MDQNAYAEQAGREYARQIASQPEIFQDGPGEFNEESEIPIEDYRDLVTRFGDVTIEMIDAYGRGYNSISQQRPAARVYCAGCAAFLPSGQTECEYCR